MITTTEFYRDFYGCTASIKHNDDGAILVIRTSYGTLVKEKTYRTRLGAFIAMCKASDCWRFTGMETSGKLKL